MATIKPADFTYRLCTMTACAAAEFLRRPFSVASTTKEFLIVVPNTPVGGDTASMAVSALFRVSISSHQPSVRLSSVAQLSSTSTTAVPTRLLHLVTEWSVFSVVILMTPPNSPTAHDATATTSVRSSPFSTERKTPRKMSSQRDPYGGGSRRGSSGGDSATVDHRSQQLTVSSGASSGSDTAGERWPVGALSSSQIVLLCLQTTKPTGIMKVSGSSTATTSPTSSGAAGPTTSFTATEQSPSSDWWVLFLLPAASTMSPTAATCSSQCWQRSGRCSASTTPPACSYSNRMGLGHIGTTPLRSGWPTSTSPSSQRVSGPGTHPTSAPSNRSGLSSPNTALPTATMASSTMSSASVLSVSSGTFQSPRALSCLSPARRGCGNSRCTTSGRYHSEVRVFSSLVLYYG